MQSLLFYILQVFLWVVALMSGFLSLARELLLIYRGEAVQSRSLFWNCIIIAFVVSSSALWYLEHRSLIDAQIKIAELQDEKTPKLTGQIEGIAVAPHGLHGEDCAVIISATIKNTGAPSVAEVKSMTMVIGPQVREGETVVPPENLFLVDQDVKLTRSEYLTIKTMSNPVPRGGAAYGYLLMVFHGITRDEAYKDKAKIVFTIQDITGNPLKLDITLDEKKERRLITGKEFLQNNPQPKTK